MQSWGGHFLGVPSLRGLEGGFPRFVRIFFSGYLNYTWRRRRVSNLMQLVPHIASLGKLCVVDNINTIIQYKQYRQNKQYIQYTILVDHLNSTQYWENTNIFFNHSLIKKKINNIFGRVPAHLRIKLIDKLSSPKEKQPLNEDNLNESRHQRKNSSNEEYRKGIISRRKKTSKTT